MHAVADANQARESLKRALAVVLDEAGVV